MTNPRARTVPGVKSSAANARTAADLVDSDPTRGRVVGLPPPPDDGADYSALDAVLEELGAVENGTINVFRLTGRGQEVEFVSSYSPDEVQGSTSLLERIALDFGGGAYRVHVRDGAGFLANRRINIAQRKAPAEVPMHTALERMMERQTQQFGDLIKALAPQPRSASETEEGMLARLKMMAEIVRPASGTDTKELLTLLMQGVTLGKSMQPAADTGAEALMASALQAFAPVIADAAKSQRRTLATANPTRLVIKPPPTGRQVPASEAPPTPAADAANDPSAEMRALLSMVVRAAEANADPALYAELIADQVGDAHAETLLAQPDPIGILVTFDPRVGEHRGWFVSCLQAMRALYDETDPAPADGNPLGTRGGDSDPADHAQAH